MDWRGVWGHRALRRFCFGDLRVMRGMSLAARAVVILFSAWTGAARAQELPPAPNRDLVYGQCRTCHDLQYLTASAGIPRAAWADVLDSMKQYGLRIPADQRDRILDYLGTYLGPNPPPAGTAAAPAPEADGATVYAELCAACHQPNGQGVPGQFPPLAGNPDLFAARDYPARVVLFGLKGRLTVGGKDFNAEMPPLDMLDDARIAAVIEYVRHAWGNDALRPKSMAPVDPATVAQLRRAEAMRPEAVHAYLLKSRSGAGATR